MLITLILYIILEVASLIMFADKMPDWAIVIQMIGIVAAVGIAIVVDFRRVLAKEKADDRITKLEGRIKVLADKCERLESDTNKLCDK